MLRSSRRPWGVGAFIEGKQVNFENQAGGHGSIGGEQLHPFLLAKREWGSDTTSVRGAHHLHPLLCSLRDRLAIRSPIFDHLVEARLFDQARPAVLRDEQRDVPVSLQVLGLE